MSELSQSYSIGKILASEEVRFKEVGDVFRENRFVRNDSGYLGLVQTQTETRIKSAKQMTQSTERSISIHSSHSDVPTTQKQSKLFPPKLRAKTP
jgi:hypothetical protein